MAERYLREGIDCDENGEYTERSTGIYNAINDKALIIIAEETGNKEYLKYVKLNLDMMLNYFEPDGSLFTQNSTRIDKGEGNSVQIFRPTEYYQLYLYMAYKLKDKKYASIADYIFSNSNKWSGGVPCPLYIYMLKEEFKAFEIEKVPIPASYNKYYKNSGIVRKRNGKTTYTIVKDSSRFLFINNGNIKCYLKLCASFFAAAQFKAQEISIIPDGYKLSFKTQGFYRMPFKETPETSDWRKMDHSKRELANSLDLKIDVYIYEKEDGVDLRVVSEGCDRVPVKLEFGFTPYAIIDGNSFSIIGEPGQSIVIKSGEVKVSKGIDAISISPAFGNHTFTTDMRGSEPQSKNDYTIYFTDYTNIDRTVNIKIG